MRIAKAAKQTNRSINLRALVSFSCRL